MMDIDEKLNFLYEVLIDNNAIFEDELIKLIANPAAIINTNKFTSLLSVLKNPKFIGPLLEQIDKSEKSDMWLTDFLYAVSNLLEEATEDDTFETPEHLVEKTGTWVLEETGELSWMASGLLMFSDSELAEEIQVKKLQSRDDFFLVYVNCLLGLLRFNKEKYTNLLVEISADVTRDEKLRQFCLDKITDFNNN